MKKHVAICATLTALAWAGAALAETPQCKLTGSATISSGGLPGSTFAIGTAVIDGGTSYVGLGNDYSGNCDGDSGTLWESGTSYNIVCAHYVASSVCCNAGSPKMRLAYEAAPGIIDVILITDNGIAVDTFALGFTSTLTNAKAWVNLGARGSGIGAGAVWGWLTVTGNYTITASQT